ncbi:PP2C family protein-serine/threonine phosphatase [Ekhidna sp.]
MKGLSILMKLGFLIVGLISSFTLYSQSKKDNSYTVEKGYIDLSNYNPHENDPIALNGDWEFYWETLLDPADSTYQSDLLEATYYTVPEGWSEKNDVYNIGINNYGYGSYRLNIHFGKPQFNLGLKVRSWGLANKIFINGEVLGQSGQVGTSTTSCVPESKVEAISFDAPEGTAEIIIHSSNFHNRAGGLAAEIVLGDGDVIQASRRNLEWLDLFLVGSIFIMGVYHIGLFFVRKKTFSPLLFALFCFTIALRIITNENFGTDIITMNGFLHRKIDYLTYYLAFGLFFFYSTRLFHKDVIPWVVKIALGFILIFSIGVAILPMKVYTMGLIAFQLFTFVAMLYLTFVMILATIRKRDGARIYLIGWILLFTTGINDLLHFSGLIETTSLSHIGILLFILSQALLLMFRYERSFKRSFYLGRKLNHVNKNLEKIVAKRTKDLAEKNKSITESISYAEKIQTALLPRESDIKKIFPNSFIVLKPKDVVSGDFYWFAHLEETKRGAVSIIVAADCTGHGLSGALMTMSGSTSLDQIVNLQGITSPDSIAASLNNSIRNLLHQTDLQNSNQDGIDAAICTIYHDEKIVEYAGANGPLIFVNDDEIETISPTKISLGGNSMQVDNSVFQKHSFSFEQNDVSIYLFSDGYINQVGSPKNEAFGITRLKKLILKNSKSNPRDKALEFDTTLENWIIQGKANQSDDMLIMGINLSNT